MLLDITWTLYCISQYWIFNRARISILEQDDVLVVSTSTEEYRIKWMSAHGLVMNREKLVFSTSQVDSLVTWWMRTACGCSPSSSSFHEMGAATVPGDGYLVLLLPSSDCFHPQATDRHETQEDAACGSSGPSRWTWLSNRLRQYYKTWQS